MSSTVSDGATFDGTDDYISLTNFQLGSTFTIESYHKFASSVPSYGTVFSFGDNINGYSNWLSLDINGNGPTYRYAQKNGTSAAGSVGVGNIVFGEYQHIVITVTPTTIKFYENGSLINTTTSGVSAIVDKTRSYHRLGMNIGNNTEYFESNIKYFRVWNGTALPISEVTNLYENKSIIGLYNAVDYGHFLIKSSDFGQTMNFDLSASAINMVTHQNSDLSFNSMIGSRHVSCSADGKYVICSVHGFTPEDDLNIVSATNSSANWYPVLSRDYGNNWDLLTSKTFKEYHLLDNTDLSFNTSNSLNNCLGTAVSKTGKYVACAFNSAASIPKPIMFYLSSDYGKTFDLKANLAEDDLYPLPTYNYDFINNPSLVDSISSNGGTLRGDASLDSNGLNLDGTGDRYEMDSTNFTWGGTMTIEFYINVTSVTSGNNFIGFGKDQTANNGYFLVQERNTTSYRAYFWADGGLITIGDNIGTISTTTPDHHVIVFELTSGIKWFLNGTLVSDTNASYSSTAQSRTDFEYKLGAAPYNEDVADRGMIGKFLKFRYWQGTALSSSQVATLYSNRDYPVNKNGAFSNGLQISLSSNAETISLVPTKSAREVYYSSDYGTTWNTTSIALSNDHTEHYSQISSNSQYLVRNITSEAGMNSKLCKQITPYEKTYYTHMVKDFSNISNGNSSADSSITYSGGILTASDYRLKSNVQQLQDETVDNLQPVKFRFKNSQQETFGLIAHELESIYPFLVDGEKDGSHYQTVNYNGLLGVLVHELQLIRKGLEEYE